LGRVMGSAAADRPRRAKWRDREISTACGHQRSPRDSERRATPERAATLSPPTRLGVRRPGTGFHGNPTALTPTRSGAGTLTTRPFSRNLEPRASAATKSDGQGVQWSVAERLDAGRVPGPSRTATSTAGDPQRTTSLSIARRHPGGCKQVANTWRARRAVCGSKSSREIGALDRVGIARSKETCPGSMAMAASRCVDWCDP